MKIAYTLRNYNKKNLGKDILAGLIIMAVSIPISMGYAQISGLPAVYGLYGSVFPILLFALFSTSPQFIFGVDAAPAALIGSALAGLNITAGSAEALAAVPMLTFFVALWLLIFSLLKAGKLVNYISAPVMGGFITGICTTIILMQVPKLMGGTAGIGEFLELAEHIAGTAKTMNLPSVMLGVVSLAILLIAKKKNSKISDGSGTDGSRSRTHKRAPVAGLGHSDTGSGRTGTSNMEFAGFLRSSVKRGGYDQFVRGGRYHGRNVAGRE